MKYEIDYVLQIALAKVKVDNFTLRRSHRAILVLHGATRPEKVRLSSTLHMIANKGCVCMHCGAQGTHFETQKVDDPKCRSVSHNMVLRMDNGHIMTQDHIVPKAKGGTNIDSNLQPLCEKCNGEKAANIDCETKSMMDAVATKQIFMSMMHDTAERKRYKQFHTAFMAQRYINKIGKALLSKSEERCYLNNMKHAVGYLPSEFSVKYALVPLTST